jgi:hypothetical protein
MTIGTLGGDVARAPIRVPDAARFVAHRWSLSGRGEFSGQVSRFSSRRGRPGISMGLVGHAGGGAGAARAVVAGAARPAVSEAWAVAGQVP